jgi:tRNA(Ile)-lysidine synthase
LLTLTGRALLEECGVTKGDRLLLAVSGGVDSMCLLHALAKLREKRGFEIVAHGVDHGLRAEASAELDSAQRFAEKLAVPFGRTALQLAGGGNIQHRAREARYAALSQAAQKASASLIATAHHADDRAETVLIRLLQGAGPTGLAVLPARAADRIRPFIRATRGDILRHVERHRIPYSDDPSNKDRRFLRSQVRHDLLPVLVRLSPGLVSHLNALADALGAGVLRADALGVGAAFEGKPPPRLGRAQLQALWAALEKGQAGPRIRINDRLELSLNRPTPGRIRKNR